MTSLAGPGLALAAAVVLGSSDFIGGLFSRRLRAAAVAGWSHAMALLVLLVIAAVAGAPTTLAWVPWAALGGVCSGLGLVAFYAALASGTVGVVAPIAAMGIIVPLVTSVVLGERPGPLAVAGIVVALVGGVLASGPELRHDERVRARAVVLAAISGIAFGVMMIGIMKGAESSALFTQVGMRATSSIGFVLYALSRRSLGGVGRRDVAKLTVLGLLDVFGNLLISWSSQVSLKSITVVVSSLYSVVTVLLGVVVLKERLRGIQLAGVILALLGVVLMNVPA